MMEKILRGIIEFIFEVGICLVLGIIACVLWIVAVYREPSFTAFVMFAGLLCLIMLALLNMSARRRTRVLARQPIRVDHLVCHHPTLFAFVALFLLAGVTSTTYINFLGELLESFDPATDTWGWTYIVENIKLKDNPLIAIVGLIGTYGVGHFIMFIPYIIKDLMRMDGQGIWHPLYGNIAWGDIDEVELKKIYKLGKIDEEKVKKYSKRTERYEKVLLFRVPNAAELRERAESRLIIGRSYENDHLNVADDQIIVYVGDMSIPDITYAYAVAAHLFKRHARR